MQLQLEGCNEKTCKITMVWPNVCLQNTIVLFFFSFFFAKKQNHTGTLITCNNTYSVPNSLLEYMISACELLG